MKIWNLYWRRRVRRGLTLVEVVAASTLMASLLVSILLAFGSHQRQLRAADQRLNAITLADTLLEEWGASIPRNQTGIARYEGAGWPWRTRAVRRNQVANVALDVIRLEVFAPVQSGSPATRLSSVEVLTSVPLPK